MYDDSTYISNEAINITTDDLNKVNRTLSPGRFYRAKADKAKANSRNTNAEKEKENKQVAGKKCRKCRRNIAILQNYRVGQCDLVVHGDRCCPSDCRDPEEDRKLYQVIDIHKNKRCRMSKAYYPHQSGWCDPYGAQMTCGTTYPCGTSYPCGTNIPCSGDANRCGLGDEMRKACNVQGMILESMTRRACTDHFPCRGRCYLPDSCPHQGCGHQEQSCCQPPVCSCGCNMPLEDSCCEDNQSESCYFIDEKNKEVEKKDDKVKTQPSKTMKEDKKEAKIKPAESAKVSQVKPKMGKTFWKSLDSISIKSSKKSKETRIEKPEIRSKSNPDNLPMLKEVLYSDKLFHPSEIRLKNKATDRRTTDLANDFKIGHKRSPHLKTEEICSECHGVKQHENPMKSSYESNISSNDIPSQLLSYFENSLSAPLRKSRPAPGAKTLGRKWKKTLFSRLFYLAKDDPVICDLVGHSTRNDKKKIFISRLLRLATKDPKIMSMLESIR